MTFDRDGPQTVHPQTVLRWLREEGPATAPDVAEQTELARTTASKHLRALFADGAVVRAHSLKRQSTSLTYAYPDTVSRDGLRQWEHVDDDEQDDDHTRDYLP